MGRKGDRVLSFDRHGRPVRDYPSVAACAQAHGISATAVRDAIDRGRVNEATGLFFDYAP